MPGLVSWPGTIPGGTVGSEVVHLVDLMPTLVAAAGGRVNPAWHVNSVNLLPVWTGKAQPAERTLFWEWRSEGGAQLAALRNRMKLVVTGGRPELYDVVNDPGERHEIFGPVSANHLTIANRHRCLAQDRSGTLINSFVAERSSLSRTGRIFGEFRGRSIWIGAHPPSRLRGVRFGQGNPHVRRAEMLGQVP